MTTARIRPVVLAIACLAFPLLSDAKPGKTDARRVTTQTVGPGQVSPTGLGKRDPSLAYVSVPGRAFMPSAFVTSALLEAVDSVPSIDNEHTRYKSGTATVFLPDGARLRTLSCFGSWDHDNNVGKGIKLDARGLAGKSEMVGKAAFFGGSGYRRLDAELDHLVDNFQYAYELKVSLDVKAQINGCRIGYEVP